MKLFLLICGSLAFAGSMFACSVYMESTRPTPTDLNYFQVGMQRDQVLEKLGAPDSAAVESDGAACDFYKLYTRGYGAGGKIPIAVAEGAADFFTLGLAEIALTPTEGLTKNEKHPVAFCYKGQTLVRITTDNEPNVAGTQGLTVQPLPTLSAGENPPITAGDVATAQSGFSATATPTSGATPAAALSSTPTPLPPR